MKKTISLFMIWLILTIPFYTSSVFGQTEDRVTGHAVANVGQAGRACVEKYEESGGIAEVLDNEVIGVLETVASIMFMICTVMSAIHIVLSTLGRIIGMHEGSCCLLVTTAAGSAVCKAMDRVYKPWKDVYKAVEPFCCYVNCGWCTGKGCAGIKGKIPAIKGYEKFPGLGSLHLSPYENIYSAMYCLCPTAILFNLRKLKTIYETYNCCVEQACIHGISLEACERQLDEALCMYWQGSLAKSIVKILLSLLTNYLKDKVAEMLQDAHLANCILALLDLANIPTLIQNVQSSWQWMTTTFSEPSCGDLGFGDIEDRFEAEPFFYRLTLADTDGDGVLDSEKTTITESDLTLGAVFTGAKGRVIIMDVTEEDAGPEEGMVSNYEYNVQTEESGLSERKEGTYEDVISDLDSVSSIRTEQNSDFKQRVAYELTWTLLEQTLGRFAYDQIDEMCEQDWESSESQ